MQAIGMVYHVPVSAVRSLGTAARVNDAAKAIGRRPLGFEDCAAASQPTRSGRRRRGAEIPTELKRDDRHSRVRHKNILAKLLEGGPSGQGSRIHANGISVEDPRYFYFSNSEPVRQDL